MHSTVRYVSVRASQPALRVRFKMQNRFANPTSQEVQTDVVIARTVGAHRGVFPSIVVAPEGKQFVASLVGEGVKPKQAKEMIVRARTQEAAFAALATKAWVAA